MMSFLQSIQTKANYATLIIVVYTNIHMFQLTNTKVVMCLSVCQYMSVMYAIL